MRPEESLKRTRSPALPPLPPCFGREALVSQLAGALAGAPDPRVAILGPAGIGKSTVALAALHRPEVAGRYGDRRYFVRLDAAPDGKAATAAIAEAVPIEPGGNQEIRVSMELHRGPALLVLDNLDLAWASDPKGVFLALLTVARPGRGFALVISLRQEPLPGHVPWAAPVLVPPLEEADAVEAFCAIAGDEHRSSPALRPLLTRLSGIPLGITLLARAAEGSSLERLEEAWRTQWAALPERGDGQPEPDRGWKASLEVSLRARRMTDDARRVAALLGVLPGGVALQDLQAMSGPAGPDAGEALVQLGLAYVEGDRLCAPAAVREHLAAAHPPPADEMARVMEHYRDLALAARPELDRGNRKRVEERIISEMANLRAMIRRGLLAGCAGSWIDAALALSRSPALAGDGASAIAWALEAARSAGDIRREADCLRGQGYVEALKRREEQALALYEQAQALYRRAGDALGEAHCCRLLGNIALRRSDLARAIKLFEQAGPLFRKAGDVPAEASWLREQGDLAFRGKHLELARATYEKAAPLYRELGDARAEAYCLARLRILGLLLSDREQGNAVYEDVLSLYEKMGSASNEARCIRKLADVALQRSDHENAEAMYEHARAIYQELGDVGGEGHAIQGLGDLARARGDAAQARACYEAALERFSRIPNQYWMGRAYRRLARIETDPAARQAHIEAARAAWDSLSMPSLMEQLDREFPRDASDPPARCDQDVSPEPSGD